MFEKVLIANRGEIALRIVRALQELNIASVAVYADDDAQAPHVQAADSAVALGAAGPAAYLDAAHLIAIAREQGADAIHPGYGFLSERADFARDCAAAGLVFIGPTPEQLALLGDKAQARALAQRCGVPLLPGSPGAVTLDEAQAFLAAQGGAGVMLKAVSGGGGRGMRAVRNADELAAAYERCRSEARAAFGVDGVYVERLMEGARHIGGQQLTPTEAVLAALDAGCDLALMCNQSLQGGEVLDDVIDGLAKAQLTGRWRPSAAADARRTALIPVAPSPDWDELMRSPEYLQSLGLLPDTNPPSKI